MKNFLVLFFALVSAVCTQAQTYDETELLGKWNVTSITGQVNNDVISFESLYLGDTLVTEGEVDSWLCAGYLSQVKMYDQDIDAYDPSETCTYSKVPVSDFFISNNNKLHINHYDTNMIRLVIKGWANDVMKLESYDGKTKIELKKDRSYVNAVISETPEEDRMYDVQGHKVTKTQKGNVYIRNHRKFIAR